MFKEDIKYQTAHSCTIRQENGKHIIWILKIMLHYIVDMILPKFLYIFYIT